MSSDCHFLRCVKSNEKKSPNTIQENTCMQQIRCLGVLETIRVRLESYPVRKLYRIFYKKYSFISLETENYADMLARNADFKELVMQ